MQETDKFVFDSAKQNQPDPPITNGSIQLEINGRCDPPDSIKKPIIFRLWKEKTDKADSLPLRCEDAPFHPVFSNLSSGVLHNENARRYNLGAAIKDGEWLGDSPAQITIDASLATVASSSASSNSSALGPFSTGTENMDAATPTTTPTPTPHLSSNPSSSSNASPSDRAVGDGGSIHSDKPAIIGGVIGGGVGLIILVFSTIIFQRRRRKTLTEQAFVDPYPAPGMISKVLGNRKMQRSNEGLQTHTEPEANHAAAPTYIEDITDDRKGEPVQQRARRVRYHDDSGWRPLPAPSEAGDSSVLDMPPHYDAAM
ncbi:hypothetical protein VNI00_015618 [Paramarasmius palmivorus]|uniref:Mid2 domain-containing protein n=1 Tax=Paramarasmius palmivorus TaxID=297713 RepID=A0AAW0BJX0_9AGAR